METLERSGDLVRIRAEVDPRLEVSEITQRVVRRGGPALLFERVRGAGFPLATNLFGSMRRIEIALGRHPRAIGEELLSLAERLNPPSLKAFWSARGPLARMRFARPSMQSRAPVQEVVEPPGLDRLPNLTTWPRDGGPFVTWGPTLTHDPATGRRNFGLYRLHVYGPAETGMHWQSMKGGRGHYFEAERRGQPLEVAVVLGGDPVLMLSAIFPLPEGFDELSVAGWIRGAATPMVRAKTLSMAVPAAAEFILEGHVPPGERRMEGPFGDHFGHYSEASPFPVFHVRTVTRRRDPIYPGTVVGRPPQEDKFLGIAAGEVIGPLARVIHPNVTDLYAHDAACFHNLLAVAMKERHPKEVLKTAIGLLGTGQLSLTKVLVCLREDVDPRSFRALLTELWRRFDPEERMLLIPIAPLDTLDYTSFQMHVGSKLVLDATGEPVSNEDPPAAIADPTSLDSRIRKWKVLPGGFVVVVVSSGGREVLGRLLPWEGLGRARFLAAVSEDVDLEDEESTIWGIFSRFDPARDMLFSGQEFLGARPIYRGRLAIDATWKDGYPLPLKMSEEIVQLVDRRWNEYGIRL
ncbi:MAG TPA: UbiD family decarboxylase [Thermoanaerobaculia bacterium]|nr:UbiD family decarboxylase [Thermoanaerobaculia bacterium]